MARHIRNKTCKATVFALLAFAFVSTFSAYAQDIEKRKIATVQAALEKLGRPAANPALMNAAKDAEALTDIRIVRTDGETLITISTTGDPTYRHFPLDAQNSFVVDFYNTINLRHGETFEAKDSPIVNRVRTSLFQLDPQFTSRVVIDMDRVPEMLVSRTDGTVSVRVPDAGTLPEVEPAVPTAQSIVVAGLKKALEKQRGQVAEAEAKLKKETELRTKAEADFKAALDAKENEVATAIEAERAALAEARNELEEQVAQREATEAGLAELAEAVKEQKKALAETEAELQQEGAKKQQTEAQFAEAQATLKRQQQDLAALETELAASRQERDKIESSLREKLLEKEADARRQIEDRQVALDKLTDTLDKERSEKKRLAAELSAQLKEKERLAQAQLDEQKTALAQLDKELESARKKIEQEETAKAEFEAKLEAREKELESVIDNQNVALEETRGKLASEAEARAAAEDEYKQKIADARVASEDEAERLKTIVADVEKKLAAERKRTAEVEEQLRAQLAERDEDEAAATELEASMQAAAQQKIADLEAQIAARDELLTQVEKELADRDKKQAEPPPPPENIEDIFVTLTFRNAPLTSVLDILARRANINILAGAGVQGEVTARFNNVPLMMALKVVLRDNDYDYVVEDGIYRVVPAAHPQSENMRTEFVRLNNASAGDVEATLKDLISPSGTVVANTSANAVVIVDSEKNIARLKNLALELDSSLEGGSVAPGQAGLLTKSFTLTLAEVADVSSTVEQMLSPQGKIAANESANVLIVTDHPTRIEEIERMIEELDVARPIVDTVAGIFRLSYADAGEVADVLKDVVTQGVGSVLADARTNQVIVSDTPSNFEIIEALIPELDQRVPQVYIKVMMVDVVLNDDAQYGVKWLADAILKQSHDLQNLSVGSTAGDLFTAPTPTLDATEISFGIVGNDVDLSAVIAAEVQDRDAQILATPDILVLNNRQATIEIVQEVPFQEMTQTTQGPPVSSTEFKDIGVTLTVSPQITHDRSIILQVRPEESSISGFTDTGIPIEDSRRADTTLLINDAATVYIGGLRNTSTSLDVSKVPVIGDIPYLGYLFRNTKTADHRTELMVFLSVHILDDDVPGLTPDEQRAYDRFENMPDVPDATRDLLRDMHKPSGIREPVWKWRRQMDLPKTK